MQQNELELVFELDGDFFGRKMKYVGAGISGGGPLWAHEAGGVPSTLVARWLAPLVCSLFHKSSNILGKIILNWHGILRTFIFGIFLYCTDKSGNRQKNTILLYFY